MAYYIIASIIQAIILIAILHKYAPKNKTAAKVIQSGGFKTCSKCNRLVAQYSEATGEVICKLCGGK